MTRLLSSFCPDSPANQNMVLDRAMMDLSNPSLRVYTWSPPTISLGMSQDESILDLDACEKEGLAVVKRFTGGAAVLHKDDVTYSFFYPSSLRPARSARELRRVFMTIFIGILKDVGVPVSSSGGQKWVMPESGVCFQAAGDNEILVGEKKVVGSAQSVKRSGVFQHGSLALKAHEDLLCRLVKGAEPTGSVAGLLEFCSWFTAEDLYHRLVDSVTSVFGFECDER